MPYIKKSDRGKICDYMDISDNGAIFIGEKIIRYKKISTAGELQYAMAVMFKSYMERKGLSYQNCNDIMGALAGAQQEFYRRTVVPYEDKKIEDNGDI